MTREQINFIREKVRHDIVVGLRPDLEPEEVSELIAAAERALVLEDVLTAAKEYRKNYDKTGALLTNVLSHPTRKQLFAAIDRTEGTK